MASAVDLALNHNSALQATHNFSNNVLSGVGNFVSKAADFTRNIDTHVGNFVDGFFAIPDKVSVATTGKPLDDVVSSIASGLNTGNNVSSSQVDYSGYSGGAASAPTPSTPQSLVYLDAPLAEHYGMDASTAYQEALSNNAYQRKIADLKAAGLNPVLGISGSGATSFYGTPADASSGGSSGGYSFGSAGSAKSTSLLKNIGDQIIYNAPYVMSAIVGLGTGFNPGAVSAAYSAGVAIKNIHQYS